MTPRRQAWSSPALASTQGVLLFCAGIVAAGLAAAWALRFFSDDGAILWRYADHLRAGAGLRYNLEEAPVEGASNLPYVLLLALLFACGLDAETASLTLGFALAPLAYLSVWSLARRAGLPGWAACAALAALAAHHSWASWTSGGLDMRFGTLLVVLALSRVLLEEREPARRRSVGGALLGLVAIARPEGFLFAGLVFAWRLLARERRIQLGAFLAGFAALKLAQLVFQLAYFHDWLPNTAHAKVTGLWLAAGSLWLLRFALVYLLPLTILLALAGAWQARRRAVPLRFLLWIALGYLGALACIGGERFEFRLADPALPLLYVSAAGGAALLLERWLHRREELWLAGRALACAWIVLPAACGHVLRELPFVFDQDFERVEFTAEFYARQKRLGLALAEHFPATTRLGIGAAGAAPFFSRLYTLDLLGLNDRIIARRPADPGRPLWHQKHARPEDHERARVDLVEPRLYDRHPALEAASAYGLDVDALLQGQPLDPAAMPASLSPYFSPEQMPHAFCVRVGPSSYLLATTRGPALLMRNELRARGLAVLF
ncbi:MAG: hypothetical protein IPN34_15340 [Planctomycetes bacterium]|nr:hypothetical protein [Planctomycetota bacterium]